MPAAVAAWAVAGTTGATVVGVAVASFSAAVTAGIGTAIIYAGAYVLTAAVISIGISALSGAIMGKPSLGSFGQGALTSGSPIQMSRESAPNHRIIYGQTRVSGPMLDALVSGSNNEYLQFVVGLAAHECKAIDAVYFGDTVEPLDGSGYPLGDLASYARVKKWLGGAVAAADSDFVTDSGGSRSTADRFSGIAALYGRFKWDQSKWPGGFPNLSAIVKGRLVYDPRTATTDWSDNPALCIRDYLTNAEFGLGVDSSEIDDASFIEAANVCDESVALAAGGSEKRYCMNGCFELAAEPATVLQKMVESMAGAVTYVGGQWICYAGAHRTPETSHLTADDLRAGTQTQTKLSMRDTCNRVRGTFSSPEEGYQRPDFVPIVNALYLAEDGGIEVWRDLAFAFVTSHSQAQRLAKIDLERTRQDISSVWPCKLTALRYKVGDVVPVDSAEDGWTAKLFVITAMKIVTYEGAGFLGLGVDVSIRETAAEVWDWNDGEETTYDPAANTDLPNILSVPTPASVTLNAVGAGDATELPRFRVSWTLPTNQFVLSGGFAQIRYKKHANTDWEIWNTIPGDHNVDFISDLEALTNYDVAVRFQNVAGVFGAWCSTVSLAAPANDLTDNYYADLTNNLHGVACDAEGNALSGELGSGGRAMTDVFAFVGSTALAAVTSSPGIGQFSFTAALLSGTATFTKLDDDTLQVDTLGTASAVIRVTVDLEGIETILQDFSLVKSIGGGAYWLQSDAAAVKKATGGAYTPAVVNFTGFAKLLVGAPAAYAGRFIIATLSGVTWTNVYTSASDESTKAYTVPASILAIRCRLYLAGGTSTLVDEEIIPIVEDGAVGATGAPGATGGPGGTGPAGPAGATLLGHSGGAGTVTSTSPQPVTTGPLVSGTQPTGDRIVRFVGFLNNLGGSDDSFYAELYDGVVPLSSVPPALFIAAGKNSPYNVDFKDTLGSPTNRDYRMYAWSTSGQQVLLSGEIFVL